VIQNHQTFQQHLGLLIILAERMETVILNEEFGLIPDAFVSKFDSNLSAGLTVTCDGLTATKVGTAGNDSLSGTAGPDVIAGLGGNDTINGFGGNDRICGGGKRDIINGGPGDDHLFGQGGNDALSGGKGIDFCDGGIGTDTATGCGTSIGIP
jgi:Ca2+-binding RTX toxin-like protein